MAKYEVVIIKHEDEKVDAFISISQESEIEEMNKHKNENQEDKMEEKTKHVNEEIDNFITLLYKPKKEEVNLRNFEFNLTEILGDIQYISQEMSFIDLVNGISILAPPYEREPCLNNMKITNKYYFPLLEELKTIMYEDRHCKISDVYQLANDYEILLSFSFYVQTNENEEGYEIYEFSEQYNKKQLKQKKHIYRFPCKEITEIVMAIFTYHVLLDYHFYQCKHCKKFSSEERHQKDRPYCNRNNLLGMAGYENKCCREAIPQIFNTISQSFSRSRQSLERTILHKDIETSRKREEEYNKLVEKYKQLKGKCKNDPSPENIIALKNFVGGINPY